MNLAATPDISSLDLPVLLVAGSCAYLTPPVAVHSVHRAISDSTFVEIDGAGHFPWIDEPAAFAGGVGDFLDENVT